MKSLIERLQEGDIRDMFKQSNITRVALVWSYSRWEQNQNSDIDLVFTLDKKAKMTLFSLLKIKNDLEEKLHKRVELVEESNINKHYRTSVLADKKVIF
jgi:predicted nucleotidyltransferase